MKKIIMLTFLLFMLGHPPRADAKTVDSVTSKTSVTFVANPNLPKPSVPGENLNPSKPLGSLPKTGEEQNQLLSLGLILISLSILLTFKKRANKY